MHDDDTVPPAPLGSARDRRTATLARMGLLGIGAAALIAVALLALGSSFSPARILAGSDSTNGTTDRLDNFGFGGPGVRGEHGAMFGGVTITAINGNDLSLETEDGWTRTITVDEATEYSRSGDAIELSDLAVGDRIAFRQTLEDDGSWTIDAVAVVLPHIAGEVTAVDGSTITLEGRDGESTTITVNGETAYEVNGDDAGLADVGVGMVLVAEGTDNGDGTLTATEVKASDADGFFGGPGFGPGRHGFGFGFGPGFDRHDDDSHNATATPEGDASAS